MATETQNGLILKRGTLGALIDFQLQFEKALTALKIRNTHLEKNQTPDEETKELLKESNKFKKEFILEPVARLLEKHPAYPWFSSVKGIGNENIAKVVSLIDIERAPTISALWKYAGYAVDENGVADHPQKGKKLSFNKTLKTMCWRIGASLIKAHQVAKEGTCFGHFFYKALKEEFAKFEAGGKKVIPTIEWKKMADKVKRERNKLASLEKEYGESAKELNLYIQYVDAKKVLEQKIEDAEKTFERHVSEYYAHNRAFRRMIKLFLGCLWIYWREAEGLPTRDPYAIEKLGHTSIVRPEKMTDR